MTRRAFERLVRRAISSLPRRFRQHLDNVAVVIEPFPSDELLEDMDVPEGDTLFGLYQGTPLTQRQWDYGNALPDRITIFQEPIEEECGDDMEEMITVIGETVLHEVGHFFGLSEKELEAIEDRYWRGRHPGEPGDTADEAEE
jgi:predicted Zn-dependent protease with MMP-like domain